MVDPITETVRDRLPGHADCVVVPLANPATAHDLLELATALAASGGRVVALSVVLGDAEVEATGRDELAAVVAETDELHEDRTVEYVSQPAPSVARGILEVTREAGADLLLLGVPSTSSNGSLLGRIADSVVGVAPCDVVVVRPGLSAEQASDATRVVITVDEGEHAQTATRTGMVLADGLGVPVEVVHVLDHGRPRIEGHAVIANALVDVPGAQRCTRRIEPGVDVASTVIATTTSSDLLVVGLERESGLQRWLFGRISTDLLRNAPGPLLVVARSEPSDGLVGVVERVTRWLRPGLTDVEQDTLLWSARRQAGLTIDFLTLVLLSAVLATLGLVQDSVAVIIGAMLVAPLLGPLSAISIGLITTRTRLWRQGLVTLAIGVAGAIAISLLTGLLLPNVTVTDQMALRGQPSLLDVGVAMASGLVGAYAIARKDIPAALAGVAIAAALVPPLCTIGLGLAVSAPGLAGGAMLLFAINISAVIATGTLAFWWFGLHPVDQDAATRRALLSAAFAAGLALLVVIAVVALVQSSRQEEVATTQVADVLATASGVDLLGVEVEEQDDGSLVVTARVRSDRELTPQDIAAGTEALEAALDRDVQLRLVVELLITQDDGDDGDAVD